MSAYKPINFPKSTATLIQLSPTAKDLSFSAASERNSNLGRHLTYTFYHPTHAQSAVTLPSNKQFQRRQYRYVSQSFSDGKPLGVRPTLNRIQKEKEKNDLSSNNFGYKGVRRQIIQISQSTVKEQNSYYSQIPAKNSPFSLEKECKDQSKVDFKRISSCLQKNQLICSQIAQSGSMKERNDQAEGKTRVGQNQARYRCPIQANQAYNINQNSLKCSISLVDTPTQKLGDLRQSQGSKQMLSSRKNLNIAESNCSSQQLIMPYQLKIELLNQQKADFQQKYKKSEQSIKISRSIISTLNQKIARITRQNQANLKQMEQRHQSQLLQAKRLHEQATKLQQSIIFELKLKNIDQANVMQECLAKAEQRFKFSAQAERNQILKHLSEAINAKQVYQQQIKRLNQNSANLQSDLIRLGEQNMKMDLQINRLLRINIENGELCTANNRLKLENQQLAHQILQINSSLQQVRLQNRHLKEKLVQKDQQIAKLNITKGSLVLQNLQYKEKVKTKHSQELAQQDNYLQLIKKLQCQLASLETEITNLQQWKDNYASLKQQLALKQQKSMNFELQNCELKFSLQQQSFHIKNLQTQLNIKSKQAEDAIINKTTQINALRLIHEQQMKDNSTQIKVLLEQLQKSSDYIQNQASLVLKLRQQLSFFQSNQKQSQPLQAFNHQLNQRINRQDQCFQKQLSLQKQTIAQQRIQIDQLLRQAILSKQSYEQMKSQLQQQLRKAQQLVEQQRISIEQLNRELQMQEKDYRTIVEEQISKITMIYSQQQPSLPQSQDSPTASQCQTKLSQTIIQTQLQESSEEIQPNDLQNLSRVQLLNRIRQLQQVNKSFQNKVQEINKIQEGLNSVIISKLKEFEAKIQKNEHQKHELQQKLIQSTQNLQIMTQKCQHYEAKIQWLDNVYKQIQSNLTDTIQELLQLNAKYLDLKLKIQKKEACQDPQDWQLQMISENPLILEKEDQVALNMKIQSEATKKEERKDKFIKESDFLVNYYASEYQTKNASCNQTKQAICEENIYAIKISNVDSQSEEQLEKRQINQDSLEIFEGHFDQKAEQVDQKMSKQLENNQPQQEQMPLNSFSDFIKRTIKCLDSEDMQQMASKELEERGEALLQQTNQMSNYILNIIKNLEQKDRKNECDGFQRHEQQKHQCWKTHNVEQYINQKK